VANNDGASPSSKSSRKNSRVLANLHVRVGLNSTANLPVPMRAWIISAAEPADLWRRFAWVDVQSPALTRTFSLPMPHRAGDLAKHARRSAGNTEMVRHKRANQSSSG
jgi:hypothetical protein